MTSLISILEPVAEAPQTKHALAPRPRGLSGCRIGLLDNSQINAGVFMQRLGDLLVEGCQASSARAWRKPFWTRPAPPEVVNEIATSSDLAVVGWGS